MGSGSDSLARRTLAPAKEAREAGAQPRLCFLGGEHAPADAADAGQVEVHGGEAEDALVVAELRLRLEVHLEEVGAAELTLQPG